MKIKVGKPLLKKKKKKERKKKKKARLQQSHVMTGSLLGLNTLQELLWVNVYGRDGCMMASLLFTVGNCEYGKQPLTVCSFFLSFLRLCQA